MKSLEEQLAFYADHHTKAITKYTHMLGIPMVTLGLFIFLSWISINFFNRFNFALTWLLVAGTLIYYFMLNKKLAAIMAAIFIPLSLITVLWTGPNPTKASLIAFAILFIGGWIIQFIGHAFEKKRPAFFSSIIQALIAPIFIVIEIAEHFGIVLYTCPQNEKE